MDAVCMQLNPAKWHDPQMKKKLLPINFKVAAEHANRPHTILRYIVG